jgi:mRNA interferase MazF
MSEHCVLAMVTSQLTGTSFLGDTHFTKWREAGLPKPSLVRLAKVVTVERALIRKRLGTLQANDRHAVRQQFRRVFSELV